jgi:hypothetical protein
MDASRAAICAGVLIKVRSHLLLFYPVDAEMGAFVSTRIGKLDRWTRVEDVNKKTAITKFHDGGLIVRRLRV